MADVSFNIANPYQTQLEELARRQKMAEIMQQQSFQPIERTSYQGIEAPISPLSGLAKVLQGYMSGKAQRDISEEKKALGERYKTESSDILGRAFEAGAGTPATPSRMVAETSFAPSGSDLTDVNVARVPEGQAGAGNIVQPAYTVPGQAAVPPNSQRMAQLLMTSPDPAHKAFGLQEMQKNLQTQRFMNAGNAGNVPAAPVAAPTVAPMPSGMPGAAPAAPAPQVAAPTTPQAAALSRFGGPAGGQSMAVWMQIDPSGKAYTEQLAKDYTDQNKPTDKIRELRAAGVKEGSDAWNFALTDVAMQGGIWRRDAQGIKLVPGFAEGQGIIKEAETTAASKNALSTREVGGRNVSGTDRQFKVLFTGEADTDQEAQSVTTWAARNGINVKIQGPRPQAIGTPQVSSGTVAGPIAGGIQNLTASETAGAKEYATAGASAITKKLETSYDLAKNSVERISTLNDLKSVIDLPAFSGPGATTQLLLGQLANKFYGAANAETLANTTLKLQGLAELSLKAAGLIKGQGSITEPERLLLAKAKSAPENLSIPEYKALFKVFEKQDAAIIREHQDVVKRAKKAGVQNTDFYSVDMPIPQGMNLSPAAQKLLGGGQR